MYIFISKIKYTFLRYFWYKRTNPKDQRAAQAVKRARNIGAAHAILLHKQQLRDLHDAKEIHGREYIRLRVVVSNRTLSSSPT